MPYFFIAPAYLLFLLVAIAASLFLHFKPGYREAAKFGFGVAAGSLVGILGANLLLALITVLTVIAMDHTGQLPHWIQTTVGILVFALAFLGPFPASLFGVFAGSVAGIYVVYRKQAKRLEQNA